MDLKLLQEAISNIKIELETAITSATFKGRTYENGQKAKEALIRSQGLILRIHEVVKSSLSQELEKSDRRYTVFPPLRQSSPELPITGFIKAKDQDVVVLFDDDSPTGEAITDGPLAGSYDVVGKAQSERSIVIGVRSQLSSVDKNFDTLMERAFAETLNLRLRLPKLVMGEVYLLPVVEYDDVAMIGNAIGWKRRSVNVEKYIRTFLAISGRTPESHDQDLYKYERSALVLVDFRQTPPRIFLTLDELKQAEYVRQDYNARFELLSPNIFAEEIIAIHRRRHATQSKST